MLHAKAHGFGTNPSVTVTGPAVVIYDSRNIPIMLAVELGPGLCQTFSIGEDEAQFRDALSKYGITVKAEVVDIRV